MLSLLFSPEDGCSAVLWDTGKLPQDHIMSHSEDSTLQSEPIIYVAEAEVGYFEHLVLSIN
jgi:hypothetical protein